MTTTETTEMFGRYKITVSGPDPLSWGKYWVRIESTKSRMGRTGNNRSSLVSDLAKAHEVVAKFKAEKAHIG